MNWKRALGVLVAATACSGLASHVVRTQARDGAAQLQAAMHRETVEGDLTGAIAEYRRLSEQAEDRAVRARALLRLGGAYEKAGHDDAAKVYERLVREYGDVAEVGNAARTRLAAMRPQASKARVQSASGLLLHLAWGPGAVVNWNSFTRDGRLVTYLDIDSGNLMLRDLEAGSTRQLTNDGTTAAAKRETSYGEAWEHAISPDGRMVAYTYARLTMENGASKQLGTELRVANIDGTQRRTLATWDDRHYIGPPAWTSDQQSVAITATANGDRSEVLLFPLKELPPSVLATEHVKQFLSGVFSPDSRHLAVNVRKRLGSDDTDVVILDIEGGRRIGEPRVLLGTDRPEYALGWVSDGRHLVFDSNRNGTPGIWRLPMQDGQAAGTAAFVRDIGHRTFGSTVTTEGTLLYAVRPLFRNALIGAVEGDRIVEPRAASSRYIDVTVALGWSPDGRWFAHTTGGDGIVLQDTRTNAEKNVRPPITNVRYIVWHPNSRALVICGTNDGKDGVHVFDLETGRAELLIDGALLGVVGGNGAIYTVRSNGVVETRRGAAGAGRELLSIPPPSGGPIMLRESPDGQTLAAADPNTLWLVPTEGGAASTRFKPGKDFGQITAIAWSRDGGSVLLAFSRQGAKPPELVRVPVKEGVPERLRLDIAISDVAWFRTIHTHPTRDDMALTPWGWRGEVWRLSNFLPAR